MSSFFGNDYDKRKPVWKIYLDDAPEHVIRQTGLSRKELENVLQVLDEHRIIN